MNPTTAPPWLALYDKGVPAVLAPAGNHIVPAFRAIARQHPEHVLLRYFDGAMTAAEADQASDALAAALEQGGFGTGDRLAIYLQNVPQYLIGSLAAWKLGGVVVTVNPMYQSRELHEVLSDSGARVLLCPVEDKLAMALNTARAAGVARVLTCDARAFQTRNDPRVFAQAPSGADATGAAGMVHEPLEALLVSHAGRMPRAVHWAGSDTATLIYTSGTTGPAKGVIGTHDNLAQSVEVYRQWMSLGPGDTILAIAPLCHVTGMLAYLATALWLRATLVLTYRFEPSLFCDAVRETGATMTIGPTTVFIALLQSGGDTTRNDLRTLRKVYSGGAPMPAAVVEQFEQKFGIRVLGIYGMTEATGPTHITPREHRPPVDPVSGTLAVGVPVSDTNVLVLDDDRRPVAAGDFGELAIAGPQVSRGYWNKPAESANSFGPHGFLTGDIGFMDPQGWFYIVDRKKDQINASGFKVWPREVEDVLYEHPSVAECAVVGIAHPYRGEDVGAFVVLRAGESASAEQLRDFCRERLARYKVPGSVQFVASLPRTASGKILRRELRNPAAR